jgi:hypothetical protein
MAATAQNLKRLVRFLATMPPAKVELRNQISVEISWAARTVPYRDRTSSVNAHFFNSYKISGHFHQRDNLSVNEELRTLTNIAAQSVEIFYAFWLGAEAVTKIND